MLQKTSHGKKHPFLIAITGYICCGAAISLMVVKTGGYDSFYYVGLICIVVAFSSILPLTFYQSVGSGLLMFMIYVAPVLLFSEYTEDSQLLFFNNNFFFLFFFIVSVVKSREDYKSRETEFSLRKNLDYYASNLEKEVKTRIKKHEESELRYKELYENIIDSLVLIDTQGTILMANPNFYKLVKEKKAQEKRPSLIEFVHPEDINPAFNLLLDKLFRQIEVRDFQFRIINRIGEIFFVECSARTIQKAGNEIGYQLVIRDISFRKKLESDLIRSFDSLKNTRTATIMGLAKLTEYRDNDTGSHLERIQLYSKILTKELRNRSEFSNLLDNDYVENIYLSSILHDIGKVGIPDSVLLKPNRLTPHEFAIIKKHCKYGGDALRAVESKMNGESFLAMGRQIAYYHHEKWDGTGYPYGKSKNDIPLPARIVAIADVYDALTTKRIYKEAYSHQTAIQIIESEREAHFDPQIVDAFRASSDQFNLIRKQN